MNKLQKMKLKKILLKMKEDVKAKVENMEKDNLHKSQRDASGDLSGYSLHMADVASDNFDREMLLGLVANEQELLYKIENAIKQVKERNFGECQKCKKEIGMKRLTAVPYTELCISCQEEEDKKTR